MATLEVKLTGNWLSVIGAILQAISQTKKLVGKDFFVKELSSMGKGTQALGNAFQAIAEKEEPLGVAGNWFMSAGSTAVSIVAAKEIPKQYMNDINEIEILKTSLPKKTLEDIENRQVELIGTTLQTIGAYLEGIIREDPKRVTGGMIQSLGALTESLGLLKDLASDEKTAQQLAVIGGWLQVIGVILKAISVTEEAGSTFIEESSNP